MSESPVWQYYEGRGVLIGLVRGFDVDVMDYNQWVSEKLFRQQFWSRRRYSTDSYEYRLDSREDWTSLKISFNCFLLENSLKQFQRNAYFVNDFRFKKLRDQVTLVMSNYINNFNSFFNNIIKKSERFFYLNLIKYNLKNYSLISKFLLKNQSLYKFLRIFIAFESNKWKVIFIQLFWNEFND